MRSRRGFEEEKEVTTTKKEKKKKKKEAAQARSRGFVFCWLVA